MQDGTWMFYAASFMFLGLVGILILLDWWSRRHKKHSHH